MWAVRKFSCSAGVFMAFISCTGAGSVQHLGPGQTLQYAVVGRGAVRLHRRPCRDGPQPVINALIGGQCHAAGHQLLLQLSGQDLLLHTQGGLLLPQQQEGQEHRRAAHVVAPEVQRPRHLVQRRQHQYLCPGLPHLLPQQTQLLLTGQPGALRRQLPHRAAPTAPAGPATRPRPDPAHRRSGRSSPPAQRPSIRAKRLLTVRPSKPTVPPCGTLCARKAPMVGTPGCPARIRSMVLPAS